MEDNVRDPREDILYIKDILEKTADGMKAAAPWFVGMGIVWLVYGIVCAAQRIVTIAVPASAMPLANVGAVLGWLFYGILAVGFIAARRKQADQGLDTPARKIIDIWGVCVFLFIALAALQNIVTASAVRLFGIGFEAALAVSMNCAMVRSYLFFLLPILPLLATAVILEKRPMFLAGIVLAAAAAALLGCHTVLLHVDGAVIGTGWIAVWTIAACLLDIAPGVILLLFGRSLKRG